MVPVTEDMVSRMREAKRINDLRLKDEDKEEEN